MRTLKKLSDIEYTFSDFDIANSAIREASILDHFEDILISPDDGAEYTVLHDDIYMLFNQQRLSKILSPIELSNYIESLNNRSLNSLKSNFTDEQLFQFIKSRHIQSPSELLAWSQYLADNYEEVVNEINSQLPSSDSVTGESTEVVTE